MKIPKICQECNRYDIDCSVVGKVNDYATGCIHKRTIRCGKIILHDYHYCLNKRPTPWCA